MLKRKTHTVLKSKISKLLKRKTCIIFNRWTSRTDNHPNPIKNKFPIFFLQMTFLDQKHLVLSLIDLSVRSPARIFPSSSPSFNTLSSPSPLSTPSPTSQPSQPSTPSPPSSPFSPRHPRQPWHPCHLCHHCHPHQSLIVEMTMASLILEMDAGGKKAAAWILKLCKLDLSYY